MPFGYLNGMQLSYLILVGIPSSSTLSVKNKGKGDFYVTLRTKSVQREESFLPMVPYTTASAKTKWGSIFTGTCCMLQMNHHHHYQLPKTRLAQLVIPQSLKNAHNLHLKFLTKYIQLGIILSEVSIKFDQQTFSSQTRQLSIPDNSFQTVQ